MTHLCHNLFCLFYYRWTFPLFPVFQYYEERSYEHSCMCLLVNINVYSFLLSILRIWIAWTQGKHMLSLVNTSKLFSKVIVPIFTPTSSGEFRLLVSPLNFNHSGVHWWWIVYLTEVLIYLSLMTNDVGHLFINLLTIRYPFLVKWLFKYFIHFRKWTFLNCFLFKFISEPFRGTHFCL